jgi:hypothetical protein
LKRSGEFGVVAIIIVLDLHQSIVSLIKWGLFEANMLSPGVKFEL